jgi:hypothetical protein
VEAWKLPKPPPREWLVEGLIPQNAITIAYGHGGVGKSYLASYIGMLCLTGNSLFGLDTKRLSAVAYVDAEMDQDEFSRREYALAAGLGLEGIPKGMYYLKIGMLSDPQERRGVATKLKNANVGLIILDSLSLGLGALDGSKSEEVIPILREIETWGTSLLLDHRAKTRNARSGELVDNGPHGTVFKTNIARSTIQLSRHSNDVITLTPKKANFSTLGSVIHVRMEVSEDGDRVEFRLATKAEKKRAQEEETLSAEDRVFACADSHPDGVTYQTIAQETGIEERSVQTYLSKLKKYGRVRHAKKLWQSAERT